MFPDKHFWKREQLTEQLFLPPGLEVCKKQLKCSSYLWMSAPLMLLCTNHHLTNTRPSISCPSPFCSCFTANVHEEKNGGGWKKAAQWEEERKNREGRSGGEEGREGDAAGEWVEAPINLNLKDVRRGRHERQPAFAGPREERGALGEERDGWEGGKKESENEMRELGS